MSLVFVSMLVLAIAVGSAAVVYHNRKTVAADVAAAQAAIDKVKAVGAAVEKISKP